MKHDETTFYQKLMQLGRNSGCHQMPERSFYIKGKQFPVCERCTGVLMGNVAAYAMVFIYTLPPKLYVIGCAVMFIDWYVQYIGIHKSTNIRRLITGIIGGYSLATLYCMALRYIVELLLKLWIGGME